MNGVHWFLFGTVKLFRKSFFGCPPGKFITSAVKCYACGECTKRGPVEKNHRRTTAGADIWLRLRSILMWKDCKKSKKFFISQILNHYLGQTVYYMLKDFVRIPSCLTFLFPHPPGKYDSPFFVCSFVETACFIVRTLLVAEYKLTFSKPLR